ncbi:MAG: D-alanyl-D-alanine carboxypeptidase family protein [Lachnospiraceae bacterium]
MFKFRNSRTGGLAVLLVLCMVSGIFLCPVQTGAVIGTEATELSLSAVAAILMEASTGTVIYEKNCDERLRPASVTKIMTLLLIFDALDAGKIGLNDTVSVSEHAASMGGSQVFLEPGETQTVDTMIKCIAVASANDASVAMAEHIWGSEEEFVRKMNERAKGLGMNNTNFVNCCGLDVDNHLISARDIALMSRELITKYPQIHDYSGIWMDTITHTTRRGETEFGLTNTNKLMKQYEWATGLKTGSTSLAKCCLAATANRNGIELIAVVLAAPTSKNRFADAITLLNYGYGVCSLYTDDNPPTIPPVQVIGGVQDEIQGTVEKTFSCLFMNGENLSEITSAVELLESVKAPVSRGDVIGQIRYTLSGKDIGHIDIVSAEDIRKADYLDHLWKTMAIWGDVM